MTETERSNSELTVYMSALQLEDIPSEDEYVKIPQELIECAAALSLRLLLIELFHVYTLIGVRFPVVENIKVYDFYFLTGTVGL